MDTNRAKMVPSTMSSAQENRSFVAQETSDDSEDEKPIAASRLVRTQVLSIRGSHANSDDSKGEKPMVTARQLVKPSQDSEDDDDKPLSSRLLLTPKSKYEKRKRLLDHRANSSPKRPKVSHACSSTSTLKIKEEKDDDLIQISQRIKEPTLLTEKKAMRPKWFETFDPEQEEVATIYAVMKDTDYVQKNHVIRRLDGCDFTPIYEWCMKEKQDRKQMSREEKKAAGAEKKKQEEKYAWAFVDGEKERVGSFKVEPPGLFRGRGDDVTINIGQDAPVPECPVPGERWKEVRHDDTVTWLALWTDPINPKKFKYVFLGESSSLKIESDQKKYENARRMLKDYIGKIRADYSRDFTSKDCAKRQIAVATYLIDKLALKGGNEKGEEEADTVGCCTLKFNFLGKDSIRYQNNVEVEVPVYKEIRQFQAGKRGGDHLFDKLDASRLNAHLKQQMPGLTAKVFRTYNASITLDDLLNKEIKDKADLSEKVAVYNHANKEVAIICNHQRTISKSHEEQMSKLMEKTGGLRDNLKELKTTLERAKRGKPQPLTDADGKKRKRNLTPDELEKKIAQKTADIGNMEMGMRTKEDLKTVALGTSKLNYLDPRITVAWCKRNQVPIERMFNTTQLRKFAWAMTVDPDFRF
ncbi:DNA topoisomerase 1-like [Pyrus ussuriensis x Pyrus communis]|uniref:DNA topoisomerase I n=1 Tax=Pyrus ussuriensis x Pyrus communis TaxID=2448454 RepID=A0A5N5FIJ9_9ROSA|nr:DNA topoisomerase 1-like [Pyrus ussuriensis x Pyrus communis]